MKYIYIIIALMVIDMAAFGRNLTEMKEWREKGLPYDTRSGVRIEIYDLQKKGNDNIDINIRVHNLSGKTLDELTIKIWVWKKEGVYVEEMMLLSKDEPSYKRIKSGKEKFFPRRGSYYRLKGVKYSEMKDLKVEIGRVVSRGVR